MAIQPSHTAGESESHAGISLYDFYALGIERLVLKAPWELERKVSAYHENFLEEQRCLGLAVLLLLGEPHVPTKDLHAIPGFEDQARISVNQAVFRRALRRFFEVHSMPAERAEAVLEHMQSYINDARDAAAKGQQPLAAMLETVVKRVPPVSDEQRAQYETRIAKIYAYVSGLVDKTLLRRAEVSS